MHIHQGLTLKMTKTLFSRLQEQLLPPCGHSQVTKPSTVPLGVLELVGVLPRTFPDHLNPSNMGLKTHLQSAFQWLSAAGDEAGIEHCLDKTKQNLSPPQTSAVLLAASGTESATRAGQNRGYMVLSQC